MDKNIFNEAVLTSGQKARLKERIFETDIKIEDNKAKRVFPFKTIGMIAAAFVLVVGAAMLVGVLVNKIGMDMMPPATYSSNDNNNTVASNGGADDPGNIEIGVTDLRAKYPQYFDLDATKGLVIYTWFTLEADDEDVCVLVSGKNIGYTDDEILSMPTATVSQMKEILKSYNLSSDKISVAFFEPPYLATAEYDPEAFVKKVRKELGLDGEVTDLRAEYPQYFELDTTNGLLVQAWFNDVFEFEYGLVPYKEDEYTEDEIALLEGVSFQQMKEILSSYTISPEDISIRVPRVISTAPLYETDLRTRLGVEFDYDIQMSVNFRSETEFDVTFLHSTDDCTHRGEYQVSPEYSIWLEYNGELIRYQDYARRTGMELDIGPFAWETVIYKIENDKEFIMKEDLSMTFGKLPAGKYYLEKEVMYKPAKGDYLFKSFYAPFEIKEKPTIPEDEKDKVVSIVNGVEVRLGDGEYFEGNKDILDFDFAIIYELPTYYYDFYTENGGNLPDVAIPDENRTYKKIRVGDKLGEGLTVTSAYFNSYVTRDESGNATGFDIKTSMHGLKAEGNVTVTAYAYKDSKNADGREYVKFVIDPTKNGNLIDYDLFYGPSVNYFSYVNETGGFFGAKSSTPVLTLAEEYNEMFDREGLWEVELDITAISIAHIGRGTGVPVTVDASDIRFIRELEVSGPVAE